MITVADKGIGIPARDLERIFERFYRVDHGRSRSTGGTGLGLAIVRHVAQNHQGNVQVESREGEGATFTLRLPLQGRLSASHVSDSPPTGGRPRRSQVLLAEDEESFVDALVVGLEREGFAVTVARDGADALALFDRASASISSSST